MRETSEGKRRVHSEALYKDFKRFDWISPQKECSWFERDSSQRANLSGFFLYFVDVILGHARALSSRSLKIFHYSLTSPADFRASAASHVGKVHLEPPSQQGTWLVRPWRVDFARHRSSGNPATYSLLHLGGTVSLSLGTHRRCHLSARRIQCKKRSY